MAQRAKTRTATAGGKHSAGKTTATRTKGKARRGFAAMDPSKQREIAALGGRAAHAKGTAHEWSSTEARTAGSKGGKVAHAKGTAHEWSSDEARSAGRKGGEVAHKLRQQAQQSQQGH